MSLLPASIDQDDEGAICEAFTERAAIIEHDGGHKRATAEALARSALRVYTVVIWREAPGEGERQSMTVIAPGQGIDEVRRDMAAKWGARLISVAALDRERVRAILDAKLAETP